MASDQNTPIQLNAPFILDNRYLNAGVPWNSREQVLASDAVQEAYRAKGLTVLIGKREWWFRDGVLDEHLIPKTNHDTIVFNNVDGSYTVEEKELVTHIVAVPNNVGEITDFRAGPTVGSGEYIGGQAGVSQKLTPAAANGFPVAIYALDGPHVIQFSGIQGTGTTLIVHVFKH